MLWGAHGHAQSPISGAQVPERRPEFSPLPELKPRPPEPAFNLPTLPALRDQNRLSASLRVVVKRFGFSGNTVFSDEALRALISEYEGRELGNVEIETARLRLTEHYIKAGYINSGALLPDQDVADGVLRFQIVEGRLKDIVVQGSNRFAPEFITGRVAKDADAPLRLPALQERLQLLAQNPLIDRLNAELAPGERLGEAVLRLDVSEAAPYEVGYRFSNTRSPSIGSYLHELRASARNLFGRGVGVGLRAGHTRGLDEYSAALIVPVTRYDTLFTARYENNRAVVIEQPFGPLDIVSRSDLLEIGLSQPLYRTLDQELAVSVHYADRESETFLLGQPFSFTPGVADARSRVRSARLTLEYFHRSESQVFSGRVWVKQGLDLGGVTINPNVADSQFVTRFVQAQWVRRLSSLGNQILFRYDRQFSNGKLLPSDKFALGGLESVRGYRENRLVKDQGWFGSLEYRHPVAHWVPAAISTRSEDGAIQLVAFVDKGRAYDDREISTGIDRLASVGVGVRWDVVPGVYGRFYYAKAQNKISVPNADPQDRGLHFLLNVSKAF
ncbi:MAG TPA: ShlB/FhaC/HecB family hemolysin secretion/activation protein [Burkholderiales bacterium]|nr:ShlB/FhaC/HecB family hemolysin secretion/activation protein [Burkholderiales bacterium]